jgi:sugar phosphate isomerase/epimerase
MMNRWPIGVFASIDAGLGVQLEVASELGIKTIHLHTPGQASRTPAMAEQFLEKLRTLDITITCVFAGFEGESYADIPATQQTVGLVPLQTRATRLIELKQIADFARLLGVDVVGLHVGFVPHDTTSDDYASVVEIVREACDHLAGSQQALHLETGQETADSLLQFIQDVKRDNLFINFDPANMILYGCGEPIEALEKVGEYVRSVHCKDGRWSDKPGESWGEEVPLGQGDVDFSRFLLTLVHIGYDGPLTIEREIPQEPARQKAEIGSASTLLEDLKEHILAQGA